MLIPYSYSRLQGLQVQSGQLRSLNLIPVLSGVDSVTVCMLFTLFNKISGTREAQYGTRHKGLRHCDFLELGLGWRLIMSSERAAWSMSVVSVLRDSI